MPPDIAAVAARLHDIASGMRREADDATAALRAIGDHAHAIAAEAHAVDAASTAIAGMLAEHRDVLSDGRSAGARHRAAFEALVTNARGIAQIAEAMGNIASSSRMLALNARIEASRAKSDGNGFGAVAGEMSHLAAQNAEAARQVGARSDAIGEDVATMYRGFDDGADRLDREDALVRAVADASCEQRRTATTVAQLTAETVDRVDAAAVLMGRAASAAMTVDLIARQLARSVPTA